MIFRKTVWSIGIAAVFVFTSPDTIKPRIFDNILVNTGKSFTGKNLALHLTAVSATALLIGRDVDFRVHRFFNDRPHLNAYFIPVGIAGGLGPIVAGSVLYFRGKKKSDIETRAAGCAVFQASLTAFLYTSLLKAVTGRPNPEPEEYDDMRRLSRTFRYGFLRGGIFWGWPSGHATATTATISALTSFYPDKLWLKIAGTVWVGYTIAGVSAIGDGGMHWFSDGVAGAFMAYAIGSTVGGYYRARVSNQKAAQAQSRVRIFPDFSANRPGIKLFCSM